MELGCLIGFVLLTFFYLFYAFGTRFLKFGTIRSHFDYFVVNFGSLKMKIEQLKYTFLRNTLNILEAKLLIFIKCSYTWRVLNLFNRWVEQYIKYEGGKVRGAFTTGHPVQYIILSNTPSVCVRRYNKV